MLQLLHQHFLRLHGNEPKTLSVRAGDVDFQIELDWDGIANSIGRRRPLLGGMTARCAASFMSIGEDEDLIVLNLGEVALRTLTHPNKQHELQYRIARLLAHEACHVMNNHSGYGWRNWVLPALFGGPQIALATAALKLCGKASWKQAGIVAGYLTVAAATYWHHPNERMARAYANAHWQDWLEFIHITAD